MYEHSKLESHEQQQPPTTQQASRKTTLVKLVIAGIASLALLAMSGLGLAGTVLALVMVTPLLVLFSPVLVPAGVILSLVAAGFVLSGGCGVVAVSALTWLYNRASSELVRARNKSSFVQIGL